MEKTSDVIQVNFLANEKGIYIGSPQPLSNDSGRESEKRAFYFQHTSYFNLDLSILTLSHLKVMYMSASK